MRDGMAIMAHRTTFSLDKATALRLKRLAVRWRVSQAEVVRRSLEQAEQQAEVMKPDPVLLLQRLQETGGGLHPDQAEDYLRQVYIDRRRWRHQR